MKYKLRNKKTEIFVGNLPPGQIARAQVTSASEKASKYFDAVMKPVVELCNEVISPFKESAATEVTVELGIKLGGKFEFLWIVSNEAECDLKIGLKWSRAAPGMSESK